MVRLSRWISAAFAVVFLLGAGAAVAQGRPQSGPGAMCGGIAGVQCQGGLVCVMTGPRHPDQAGVCQAPRSGGVMCPAIYQPVCGVDGKTYSNRCVADRAGAPVAHTGQCGIVPPRRPPQVCSQIYQPVCGTDGQTYANRCIAESRGAVVAHPGQCDAAPPPPRACPRDWRPVCGDDGRTYGNRCMAQAAGAGVAHAGRCRRSPPGYVEPSPYPAQPLPYQAQPYAPPAPQPYGERG